MRVFLDFEASSLGKKSFPIEVAWVFEDGQSKSMLVRPLPEWSDWSIEAEALHGISRERLEIEGLTPENVAHQMLVALSGHELFASAPSWDVKWLSTLLRGEGYRAMPCGCPGLTKCSCWSRNKSWAINIRMNASWASSFRDFHDNYYDAVKEPVKARAEHRAPKVERDKSTAKVVNLMDALRASLRESSAAANDAPAEKPKPAARKKKMG